MPILAIREYLVQITTGNDVSGGRMNTPRLFSLLIAALFALGLTITTTGVATADDLDQLLQAVDKLEANLKSIVEQESSQRKADVAKLKQQIDQAGPSQGGDAIVQMQKDIAWLKQTVSQLVADGEGRAASDQEVDLVTVLAEIDFLRAEVARLTSESTTQAGQLASLEEIGVPQSRADESDRIDQLTEKLTAINTALEGWLASGTKTTNAPEIKRGKIRLGGYLHQNFRQQEGDDAISTFTSRRARVLMLGPINEYAQILIQTDFANSPTLLDAHFTLTPVKGLSFTVGQLIVPFSTDYMTSPSALPFVNNAMTAGLAPGRDIGAMVSYGTNLAPRFDVKLSAGVFNGAGINKSDANDDKNIIARAEFAFANMLTLAPNLSIGYDNGVDSVKKEARAYGGSLLWQWGKETVVAEYIYSELERSGRSAWYVWAGHSFATHSKLLPVIQPLVRYEQMDPLTGVAENDMEKLILGTNFYIDQNYTKIQINYVINGEEGESVKNNEILMNFQVAF